MSDGGGQEHFVQDPGWARASSPPQGEICAREGGALGPLNLHLQQGGNLQIGN